MRRVLAGTDATVALQLFDADGEPATPAAAPAVTVVDMAGDEVTDSPFATTLAGDVASFTLPDTVTGSLGAYRLSASGDTADGKTLVGRTTIEAVGGFLFGISTLRDRVHRYESEAEYPLDLLRQLRTAVEQRIERPARRAFVPRARRVTALVNDGGRIALPDIDVTRLRSLTIDGTVVDVSGVEISDGDWGWLQQASGGDWSPGAAAVAVYEHGLQLPPEPIVDAALVLAGASTVSPTIPARATAMATEVGTFRITVPGRDGPTGIPDVDVAIADWGRGDPVVG